MISMAQRPGYPARSLPALHPEALADRAAIAGCGATGPVTPEAEPPRGMAPTALADLVLRSAATFGFARPG